MHGRGHAGRGSLGCLDERATAPAQVLRGKEVPKLYRGGGHVCRHDTSNICDIIM